MLRPVFLLLAWLTVAAQMPIAYEKSPLEIDSGGKRHRFTVELALTPDQQTQGLMFRRQMAPDAGMLFVYPGEQEITMWMKNTLIPLDMVFIRKDGTIRRIAERTVPQSLATIASDGPALAVLELNGGTASRLGLKPGDRVIHPRLGG